MKLLGGQLHLCDHRQEGSGTTKASPFGGLAMAGALQLKGFTAAPDPGQAPELIDSQTKPTAERAHATGQHVPKTRQTRQPSGNGPLMGHQRFEHLSNPAAGSEADSRT